MRGEQQKHCPCCGKAHPCACQVDPKSGTITDRESRFTLIPALSDEGSEPRLQPQDLGIPIVREAKAEILGPNLDIEDALALERQVERLSALIEDEKMVEADELAEECLSRVIHFPEHRPVVFRKWWVLPLMFTGLVGFTWIVFSLFM